MQNEKPPESADTPVPPDQQPGPLYSGVHPAYYPVYIYTRPKVPGKGAGITSMVLGIMGMVYSALLALIALLAVLYSYINIGIYESIRRLMVHLFGSEKVENLFAFMLTAAVLTVLACIFAIVSLKRGYCNKISKSGLILSMVSFVLICVFIVFIGYIYPDFWASGLNAMK